MKMRGLSGLLFFFVVLSAQGSVVSYNEAVDGDLDHAGPEQLGTFGVGANTITGWMSCSTTCDFDGFAFSIPVGTEVTNITYSFERLLETDPNLPGWRLIAMRWDLWHPSGNTQHIIDFVSTCIEDEVQFECEYSNEPHSLSVFESSLTSLQPGVAHNISMGTLTGSGLTDPWQSQLVSYDWSINVAPIPAPAALWLFGSALGLLGWARRKPK